MGCAFYERQIRLYRRRLAQGQIVQRVHGGRRAQQQTCVWTRERAWWWVHGARALLVSRGEYTWYAPTLRDIVSRGLAQSSVARRRLAQGLQMEAGALSSSA